MAACLGSVAPAGAASVKASIGVSVTVVATCRIVPGQAAGCAPPPSTQTAAATTPKPMVTYSHDPKTGVVTQTIEF